MNAIEAYLLARAYTNKAIAGAGALKGAPCQIKSITSITGGHRVTFEWEDDQGETSTETMDVMDGTNGTNGSDGDDGVGISSITYKEEDQYGNYVYTVLLTDSNSYDITCPKGPQGATGQTGQTGATGNGIASIEKTSTVGLVDTYTITYTNGDTDTFTVTNGQSGSREFIGTSYEWEQLSPAQRKEYDTFQFTDDYNDANYIYLPTIYSTEEKQVGVWTDGKPLYQKTLLSVSADDVLATNVDTLVDARIRRHGISPDDAYIDTGDGYQLNDFVCVHLDNHTLTFKNWSSTQGSMSKDADAVTIRYTKTTDTAGSGIWTPSGQIAEHYSTDEEIVGTWIDGSTIYKRTTECEIPANQGQGNTHFVTSVPLDASVVDCKIVVADSVDHLSLGGYTPWYSPASTMFAGLDPSGLNVWFGGNHYAGKTMYVTLWYIKATA